MYPLVTKSQINIDAALLNACPNFAPGALAASLLLHSHTVRHQFSRHIIFPLPQQGVGQENLHVRTQQIE